MRKYLKTYTVIILSIVIFLQILITLPHLKKLEAYDPSNLTISLSGENIDAISLHQYPFSNTDIAAIPNNRIKMTIDYCNNDIEAATNVEIEALIPRDIYDGDHRYVSVYTNLIDHPEGTTIAFYDDDYNEILPYPYPILVDDRIAHIAWVFDDPIPPQTCGTISYHVRTYFPMDEGIDYTVQSQAAIVANETSNIWNYSNIPTIRALTKPLFNIMYGEDNFYKGSLTEPDHYTDCVDPVNDVHTDDTVYHRIYIHNYTYETEARGITVRVEIPKDPQYATSWVIPAEISADNADSINDTLTVNLASDEEASEMSFIDGSLVLYGSPQGDGGTIYNGTSVASCSANGGAVPCYTYNDTTGVLEFSMPDQLGCSPYVMDAVFATNLTQEEEPPEPPEPPEPEEEQDFTVVKSVMDEKDTYYSSDEVQFNVRITNTGEATINHMEFLDRFDENYLELTSVIGRHVDGTQFDLSDHLETRTLSDNTVEISTDDLTDYLGNLDSGEYYNIVLTYTIKSITAETTTCNIALADDGEVRKASQVCIDLGIVPIPPTDK